VRQQTLRLFERRGLLTHDEVEAMLGWSHGGGFSINASVRIAADDRRGDEDLDQDHYGIEFDQRLTW
jgi:hypothetical protein